MHLFFKFLNMKVCAEEPLLDVVLIIDVWLFHSCFSPWNFSLKCSIFNFNFDCAWQFYISEKG